MHLQHRPDIGGPVAGEALVGPAQRMRRHDDIVELEDRLVGGQRLDLEHVEPGAGDACRRCSARCSARWSTTGPRAVLMT